MFIPLRLLMIRLRCFCVDCPNEMAFIIHRVSSRPLLRGKARAFCVEGKGARFEPMEDKLFSTLVDDALSVMRFSA